MLACGLQNAWKSVVIKHNTLRYIKKFICLPALFMGLTVCTCLCVACIICLCACVCEEQGHPFHFLQQLWIHLYKFHCFDVSCLNITSTTACIFRRLRFPMHYSFLQEIIVLLLYVPQLSYWIFVDCSILMY